MSQLEEEFENDVVAISEDEGWFTRKVQWIGQRAAPDRVFIKRGRVVWIEFKRTGRKAVGLQTKELDRMKTAGAEVHRDISMWDQVVKILGLKTVPGFESR